MGENIEKEGGEYIEGVILGAEDIEGVSLESVGSSEVCEDIEGVIWNNHIQLYIDDPGH